MPVFIVGQGGVAEDTGHGPRTLAIMDGWPLRVPLDTLDIMRPSRGRTKNTHVMYFSPYESEENRKLRAACGTCRSITQFHHYH